MCIYVCLLISVVIIRWGKYSRMMFVIVVVPTKVWLSLELSWLCKIVGEVIVSEVILALGVWFWKILLGTKFGNISSMTIT